MPPKALVIGGTRNLGPSIVSNLLARGFDVTVFHRGLTQAVLPPEVHELLGDRSDPDGLAAALGGGSFEVVVDTTLYNGVDASAAARIFASRVGRYIMLSTGQVYLVRCDVARPFRESDYEGPTIPEPAGAFELEEWRYGIDKRAAEDELMRAHRERQFPVTALRLPMVNSERDHHHRIENYLARLRDTGPLLIPAGPHGKLRHIYGEDVARIIGELAVSDAGIGGSFNLSQDEELSIEELLKLLAGGEPPVVSVPMERLDAERLMPKCSPFSGAWMSAIDNTRSKAELGVNYTPPAVYLPRLIEHFRSLDRVPPGYEQRARELEVAREYS